MDDPLFINDTLFFDIIVLVFLAEFVTGIVQLTGATIRTIIKLSKGEPLGHLKTFWIIVGIYFMILFVLYGLHEYLFDSFNPGGMEPEHLGNYLLWGYYLMIAIVAWLFAAWGIAIWYNIRIVFNRKPKTTEHVG